MRRWEGWENSEIGTELRSQLSAQRPEHIEDLLTPREPGYAGPSPLTGREGVGVEEDHTKILHLRETNVFWRIRSDENYWVNYFGKFFY